MIFLVNSFIYTQSPLQLLLSCVFSSFFFVLLSLSPIDSIFLFFLLLNSFFFFCYIYIYIPLCSGTALFCTDIA